MKKYREFAIGFALGTFFGNNVLGFLAGIFCGFFFLNEERMEKLNKIEETYSFRKMFSNLI